MNGVDYIAELEKHGTQDKAAVVLGVSRRTFARRLKAQQSIAALNKLGLRITDTEQAIHPELSLSGISQMVRTEDGGIMWLKTNREQQTQIDRFKTIGESVLADIKPRPPIAKSSGIAHEKILSCYTLSDFHLGMFTGYDSSGPWNTEIARKTLYRWIDHAVENSLPSHTGVFLQLGDFFHANDSKGVTPASGHVLNLDIEWDDVIRIGTEALEYALERMLEKHERVHFINAEANHDPDAAKWVQRWFERLYRDNPRLTVDCTKGGFYAYQWGKTAIYAHHGHARGVNDVSKTLVAMYPKIYGETEHRYCHLGHFHHAKTKPVGDDGLMEVQIHKTLAAKDQYAATRGYVAARGARTDFYHMEHGHIGMSNVTPSMLF